MFMVTRKFKYISTEFTGYNFNDTEKILKGFDEVMNLSRP